MVRNVRPSLLRFTALVTALVTVLGLVLAGCGKFFVEREPWRRDAEIACLTSGAVREGPEKVRIQPISGPGICGADFPLKVMTLGYGGPVAVSPPPTLACPVVSVLEQWIDQAVQPAALYWFGQPVIEIKQISAYSCRGMNGDPNARISEHAFGNALDIAAFTLADGRKVVVKDGWIGAPREQGFLRDIQGAACDRFTTVLAPGADVHHYDHIHVDLMRRSSGYRACNPRPVSGAEVAARAGYRFSARPKADPSMADPGVTGSVTSSVTGSVAGSTTPRRPPPAKRGAPAAYPDGMPMRRLPVAIAGADGVD
jgi:hypothetical protein